MADWWGQSATRPGIHGGAVAPSRAVDVGLLRRITVVNVRDLADSIALQTDQAGLRRRLAEDGYLFVRRLLRPVH